MSRTRRTTLSGRALAAVCLTVAACALALSARSRSAAAAALADAESSHALVAEQADSLVRLRAEKATVGDRPRAQADVVARLQACMHAAGVNPSSLTRVTASQAQPVSAPAGGTGTSAAPFYMRQTLSFTIENAGPAEVARFAAGWRDAEPLWSLRSISLQHAAAPAAPPAPAPPQGAAPAQNDRYTATLTIENVFLAQPPTGRSSP